MIIEVDEYKKKVPGYDPDQSEDFHRASAKLADKDFIEHLKTGKYNEVVFMAGGTASGKTEFSVSYLVSRDQLVYDGTLKNFDGFQIKLHHVAKYTKNNPVVKAILIIPNNWHQSFEIFLKRERKMKPVTFFDTHIRSKLAIARVLLETDKDVGIYVSRIADNGLHLEYEPIILGNNRRQIAKELILMAQDLDSRAEMDGLKLEIDYGTLDDI